MRKVTAGDLLVLLDYQKKRCALTGIELTPETASLDHNVPISKGGRHELSNVQITTKVVNQAKGSQTGDEFVAMCRAVVAWADRPDKGQSFADAFPALMARREEEIADSRRKIRSHRRRDIAAAFESGKTKREVMDEFGCSMCAVNQAIKEFRKKDWARKNRKSLMSQVKGLDKKILLTGDESLALQRDGLLRLLGGEIDNHDTQDEVLFPN